MGKSLNHPPEAGANFGYREVAPAEKTRLVRNVFDNVSSRYDIMNDAMSGGVHRLWKREFARVVAPRPDEAILDVAGGTGDIAFRLLDDCKRRFGAAPQITLCDINEEMLSVGRERARRREGAEPLNWCVGNAECLPVEDMSFAKYTISFGLRNVTDIPAALSEGARVLKPGGQWFCLEFTPHALPLIDELYERYSFNLIPRLGGWIAGDTDSYQYLVESIRRFPAAEKLAVMAGEAGLARPKWRTMSAGIVAIHSGWRL